MNFLRGATWTWVFDSSEEETLPQDVAAFISSLFSYALAKTLIDAPSSSGAPAVPPLGFLIGNFLLTLMGVLLMLTVMRRVGDLAASRTTSFTLWFRAASVALLPLHLLLPAALVCQSFGKGVILFALIDVWVVWEVVRRWSAGVQRFYDWPAWGGVLVVLSPVLLGMTVVLFCAVMALAGLTLVLLGTLV